MKTIIAFVAAIFLFMGFVFLGMPSIIKKETASLKSEVKSLQEKIDALEKFRQRQENAWKLSGLKPDDDLQKIIKTVHSLSSKIADLENDLDERIASINYELEKHGIVNADSFKEQSAAINSLYEDLGDIWQKIYLNSFIINIKTRIVSAKIELASKNIGNAKAELQAISEGLQKARERAADKDKKTFDDLMNIVENTRSEVDVSILGANNMINLLLYELDKTLGVLR